MTARGCGSSREAEGSRRGREPGDQHTKVGQTQRGAKTGGIVHQEAPIHISNVMLVDPESKKRTRVGRASTTREQVRVAKRSNKDVA